MTWEGEGAGRRATALHAIWVVSVPDPPRQYSSEPGNATCPSDRIAVHLSKLGLAYARE
jgi:hypothetical protein